jgi:hypothetical protein
MTWTKRPKQPDQLTQDGREHYVWEQQRTHPSFAGTIWRADHPTVFEHATMTCPEGCRVLVTIQSLDKRMEVLGFDNPIQARDAIEARWRTYPGYGHNPKGL